MGGGPAAIDLSVAKKSLVVARGCQGRLERPLGSPAVIQRSVRPVLAGSIAHWARGKGVESSLMAPHSSPPNPDHISPYPWAAEALWSQRVFGRDGSDAARLPPIVFRFIFG
jgi:hypothetical protein